MYRLLDFDEEILPTDEYFSSQKLTWFNVLKLHDILDRCDDGRIPIRRKIAVPIWCPYSNGACESKCVGPKITPAKEQRNNGN